MATYGGGVKVSAAVLNTRSTSGVVYTCPANSYAIIQFGSNGSITYTVSVAGNADMKPQSGPLYVGPGQQVSVTITGSGNVITTGVEFVNSA